MLEYSLIVNLLTENHLEFLSLKGGCTGLSESTDVKMPHCGKSHVSAQLSNCLVFLFLLIVFILANSADIAEMPLNVASHLGLHCLSMYLFMRVLNGVLLYKKKWPYFY